MGLYCQSCGLERPDSADYRFNTSISAEMMEVGSVESRERKARKLVSYGHQRGYSCAVCSEIFGSDYGSIFDSNTGLLRFEQPGTDIVHFLLLQEKGSHDKTIHDLIDKIVPKMSRWDRVPIYRKLRTHRRELQKAQFVEGWSK